MPAGPGSSVGRGPARARRRPELRRPGRAAGLAGRRLRPAGAAAGRGRRPTGRRGRRSGSRRARARAARRARRRREPRRRSRVRRGVPARRRRRPRAAAAAASSASSSWSRRPPAPSRVGSMRREAPGGGGDGRIRRRSATRGPASRRSRSASTTWSRNTRRSRPRSSRRSSSADAGGGVAGRERVDEPVDELGLGEARAGRGPRRPRCGPPVEARSWSRIDSASRIPPAARRATSAIASGSASPAVGREDPLSLPLISADGEPPDVEPLEPRQDRRREVLAGGCDANMNVTKSGGSSSDLRSAFQASLRDLVRLVEDVDLAPQVGRGVVEARRGARGRRRCRGSTRRRSRRGRGPGPRGSRRTRGRRRTGRAFGRRSVQLSALARIRASDVLPVPRGPVNRIACATRPVATALRSVATTASWPTISENVCARQRR